MSRRELRNAKRGQETTAGSLERELRELQRLQESSKMEGIVTLTAACDSYFTIICC